MAGSTYDIEKRLYRTSKRALRAMMEALEKQTENEYVDVSEDYEPDPPKFWPSTIDYIDGQVGGFYGFTVLAAEKGTGKTHLAISSAIEAAALLEWQVVFFSAEDDYDGFRTRFNNYLHHHPEAQDCYDNFHYHAVGRGQTPATLAMDVATSVDMAADLPILVVIDSINSVANLSGRGYLSTIADIGLWAMLSRRMSRGDISFMVTSETNKSGVAKGEALPYWADLSLVMKKCSDHVVDLRLDKTRRTDGEGEMGKYLRIFERGEFRKEGERRRLRVVNGGEPEPEGKWWEG